MMTLTPCFFKIFCGQSEVDNTCWKKAPLYSMEPDAMSSLKPLFHLSFALICTFVLTVTVWAKPVNNDAFLHYSEGQRTWWYLGAFEAMAHTVSIRNANQGWCIENWYSKEYKAGNQTIEKTLKQFPDHSPTSIIIALIQKQCGPLK